MVYLSEAVHEDVNIALLLHGRPYRDFLFPGRFLGETYVRNWFQEKLIEKYIWTVSSDDRKVGLAWFEGVVPGENAYGVLGLLERKQGIGPIVTTLLIDKAFRIYKFHRVTTTAVAEPAVKVAQQFGRLEGTVREGFHSCDGNRYDMKIYGLLASEWGKR